MPVDPFQPIDSYPNDGSLVRLSWPWSEQGLGYRRKGHKLWIVWGVDDLDIHRLSERALWEPPSHWAPYEGRSEKMTQGQQPKKSIPRVVRKSVPRYRRQGDG